MSETETRTVPLLDLTRFDGDFEAEVQAIFLRVLRSGRFILGPEVEALEKECATYVGSRHAVGVSSGTDALLVAQMALGVGPGDEVICPTYSFFATAGSIWRAGARPVFVDIEPRTFNCDPEAVAAAVGPRTKAIIPVHLFGQCADMLPIRETAERHGIAIVEDAAQALGAEYQGKRAGRLGRLGCFSFFPSKNLGGFGDAGLVTTDDDELAEAIRVLRVHGGRPKYFHHVVGGNFRIDALQAALLRAKLRRLDEATRERQANAALYDDLLAETGLAARAGQEGDGSPIARPVNLRDRHIFNQYVIRITEPGARDRVREHLAARGVATEVYYPVPLHLQRCFESLSYRQGEFPVAEKTAKESLALPIFPELRRDEIQYVVEQLAAFWA